MYASHIKRLEKSIRSEPQSCTRSTLGEKEEEERRWHSASRTHDRIQRCGRRLSIRGPMRAQVLTEKVKQAQPPHAMHEIVACFVAGEKSFGISSECSLAVAQGRGNLTSHHPPGTGTRNRRTGGDASCRQQAAHGAPPARMRIASPLAAPSMERTCHSASRKTFSCGPSSHMMINIYRSQRSNNRPIICSQILHPNRKQFEEQLSRMLKLIHDASSKN